MAKSAIPLQIVPAAVLGYTLLYKVITRGTSQSSSQARLKAISACHATAATLCVLYALSTSPLRSSGNSVKLRKPMYTLSDNLDDSENPLIQDQSNFANALTAWETGYLVYDTWVLVHSVHAGSESSYYQSILQAAKTQPAGFGHHIALSCAFLVLQRYIHLGRERGIWIICALMLMNASTPVLHARWWARQQGSSSKTWDAVFAAAFATCRFGTVAWVLRTYGYYHGLGAWESYRKLRIPCQTGTGALVGLNALWWVALTTGMVRRGLKRSSERGLKLS